MKAIEEVGLSVLMKILTRFYQTMADSFSLFKFSCTTEPDNFLKLMIKKKNYWQ